MGLILEFSVSPEDFELGKLLCLDPDIQVRVEQLVPVADKVMPFSWVSGDTEAFEENIKDKIDYEVIVTDSEDRKLYRLEWDEDEDPLVQAIVEFGGAVLEAEGTHEEWSFRVRFREREDLSEFHTHCLEHDIPVEVKRMYNPIEVSGSSRAGMTQTQVETMVDAYEKGYFDIPRKTTLINLSEEYGISDQAVSERLRRATAKLIEKSLMPEVDMSDMSEPRKVGKH
jgi:predicted DNA binding protein